MTMDPFGPVTDWVFDLDNTLYPAQTNLFAQIDDRIVDYVIRLTGLSAEEARTIQKDYYQRYGTTLRGLMMEYDIEPDDFLEFVHDIDHGALKPDPRLGNAIRRLPGRKFIMTNGTRQHALAVSNKLGITDYFTDMFGIEDAELVPKTLCRNLRHLPQA